VYIFFEQWWKLVVWLYSVERSVDVLWYRTRGLAFEDISFQAGGLVETMEETSFREFYLVAGLIALMVSWWRWSSEGKYVRHSMSEPVSTATILMKIVESQLVLLR
jgi:hypothetical protein